MESTWKLLKLKETVLLKRVSINLLDSQTEGVLQQIKQMGQRS